MPEQEEDIYIALDGTRRCYWCGSDERYEAYHDHEWGQPVAEDRALFEKLCLEGFQAGLSWLTILRKRRAFREAFAHFEIPIVATFGPNELARLMANPGIVRNRMKIDAAIHNAQCTLQIIEEFGSFAAYLWQFEPPKSERPERVTRQSIPTTTPSAEALAKALKKRGFRFVGPTMLYSLMQSVGMVNDHVEACDSRLKIRAARKEFQRPQIAK